MPRPTAYFEPGSTIPRAALFDAEAQEEAGGWKEIKSAQLRRFFGQVMADRRQFELKGAEARDEEAQVAMALLKASTAYTAAREKSRQPLADFVAHHAQRVKTIADFRVFARHFEAVVAWHKVFESGGGPPPAGAPAPAPAAGAASRQQQSGGKSYGRR